MKKSRISLLVVAVVFGLVAGGVGLTLAKDMGGKSDMAVSETGQEGRTDVLYYCACGEGCSCGSVSKTPGNCNCGKPMKWGHMVKVEG